VRVISFKYVIETMSEETNKLSCFLSFLNVLWPFVATYATP
jgi:hypothetical protein